MNRLIQLCLFAYLIVILSCSSNSSVYCSGKNDIDLEVLMNQRADSSFTIDSVDAFLNYKYVNLKVYNEDTIILAISRVDHMGVNILLSKSDSTLKIVDDKVPNQECSTNDLKKLFPLLSKRSLKKICAQLTQYRNTPTDVF